MKWYHWLGLGIVGWLVWKGSSKASAVDVTTTVPLRQPPPLQSITETIYGGVVGIQKVTRISYIDKSGQKWVPAFTISSTAIASGKPLDTTEQVEAALKAQSIPFDTFENVLTQDGLNPVMIFVREQDAGAASAARQQVGT